MRRALLILLLLVSTAPLVRAGDVIAHESVTLNADEVRDVFLGEKQLAGGIRLVPVDNRAAQTEFLAKILQTDSQKYYARWTRKTFREGLPAPSIKGSDAEVVAFVKATPGAIGYVRQRVPGVKVLQGF